MLFKVLVLFSILAATFGQQQSTEVSQYLRCVKESIANPNLRSMDIIEATAFKKTHLRTNANVPTYQCALGLILTPSVETGEVFLKHSNINPHTKAHERLWADALPKRSESLYSNFLAQNDKLGAVTQAETPINVHIEGCENPPCVFPQREDAVVHVVFRAPRTIRSMRTVATAVVLGAVQEYDLQQESVTCDFLTNTHCPVLEDEIVFYTLRMYILPIFPPLLPVTLEFSVVDNTVPGTEVPIFCLRVPIRVGLPRNNLLNNV